MNERVRNDVYIEVGAMFTMFTCSGITVQGYNTAKGHLRALSSRLR